MGKISKGNTAPGRSCSMEATQRRSPGGIRSLSSENPKLFFRTAHGRRPQMDIPMVKDGLFSVTIRSALSNNLSNAVIGIGARLMIRKEPPVAARIPPPARHGTGVMHRAREHRAHSVRHRGKGDRLGAEMTGADRQLLLALGEPEVVEGDQTRPKPLETRTPFPVRAQRG